MASFGLKYYTMFSVSNQLTLISTDHFWLNLEKKSFSDDKYSQSEIFEIFYWLNSGSCFEKKLFFHLKTNQKFQKNRSKLLVFI